MHVLILGVFTTPIQQKFTKIIKLKYSKRKNPNLIQYILYTVTQFKFDLQYSIVSL
jgi:hypothetical protein